MEESRSSLVYQAGHTPGAFVVPCLASRRKGVVRAEICQSGSVANDLSTAGSGSTPLSLVTLIGNLIWQLASSINIEYNNVDLLAIHSLQKPRK